MRGRATDWIEDADGSGESGQGGIGPRGIGQRGWLAGDDILTLDGFAELMVAAPVP